MESKKTENSDEFTSMKNRLIDHLSGLQRERAKMRTDLAIKTMDKFIRETYELLFELTGDEKWKK